MKDEKNEKYFICFSILRNCKVTVFVQQFYIRKKLEGFRCLALQVIPLEGNTTSIIVHKRMGNSIDQN